jgi:hypothetical protein
LVELSWNRETARRLSGWLAWATALTLALVGLLATLVWLAR